MKKLEDAVRLYSDERTAAGQYAESLLQKHDVPYTHIPTGGELPYIRGPGAMKFSFRCPTQGQERFESHLELIKKYLENKDD